MKVCEHCGQCCLSGIPCSFGQILFSITEQNPQPCPAVQKEGELYYCGLLKSPTKWFAPMLGTEEWKCMAMADIAKCYIGIGDGCGMNPNQKKIMDNMRKYVHSVSK